MGKLVDFKFDIGDSAAIRTPAGEKHVVIIDRQFSGMYKLEPDMAIKQYHYIFEDDSSFLPQKHSGGVAYERDLIPLSSKVKILKRLKK